MASYGGLAIILISQGSKGASLRKGAMRVVGTTVGLAVSLFALGFLAEDRWLSLAYFSVYFLALGYGMQTSRNSYAWYVAGFVPAWVWSSTYMQPELGFAGFHYAAFRYLETTAGAVIYTLVCTLVWPIHAGPQLRQLGGDVLGDIGQVFGWRRRQLAKGEAPAEIFPMQAALAGKLAQTLATLDTPTATPRPSC